MSKDEILIKYWSQISLFLLFIGYFIKRLFDLMTKKIEVNYALYQENMIRS